LLNKFNCFYGTALLPPSLDHTDDAGDSMFVDVVGC